MTLIFVRSTDLKSSNGTFRSNMPLYNGEKRQLFFHFMHTMWPNDTFDSQIQIYDFE